MSKIPTCAVCGCDGHLPAIDRCPRCWNPCIPNPSETKRVRPGPYKVSATLAKKLEDPVYRHSFVEAVIDDLNDEVHTRADALEQIAALRERVAELEKERDECGNGHATHAECNDACPCVGSGKSRAEIAYDYAWRPTP